MLGGAGERLAHLAKPWVVAKVCRRYLVTIHRMRNGARAMTPLTLVSQRVSDAERTCGAQGPAVSERFGDRPSLIAAAAGLKALGHGELAVDNLDELAAGRAASHAAQCCLAYNLKAPLAVACRRARRGRAAARQRCGCSRDVAPADSALKHRSYLKIWSAARQWQGAQKSLASLRRAAFGPKIPPSGEAKIRTPDSGSPA